MSIPTYKTKYNYVNCAVCGVHYKMSRKIALFLYAELNKISKLCSLRTFNKIIENIFYQDKCESKVRLFWECYEENSGDISTQFKKIKYEPDKDKIKEIIDMVSIAELL